MSKVSLYEQEARTRLTFWQGKSYQVRLLDVNRKELVQKNVSTNEFGSFTTEFALPAVCLNGNFTIDVKQRFRFPYGWRITNGLPFEITFNPVEEAFYSLGDTVDVTGNVKAYNGTAIQDVPLTYTVTRRSNRRYWGWGRIVCSGYGATGCERQLFHSCCSEAGYGCG